MCIRDSLWTSDISRAHRVARKLRAGSVWVNYWDGGDMTAPFGGYKQSGNGRDKSLHAFDKYTEMKATWINPVSYTHLDVYKRQVMDDAVHFVGRVLMLSLIHI